MLHVSQLKKALPPDASLSKDAEMQLLLTLDTLPPSQVLAERLNLVGRHVIPYVLVQRESCPTHWATWNQLQPYQSSYPGRCPRRLLHREDALQLKEEGLSRNGPYAMHSVGLH